MNRLMPRFPTRSTIRSASFLAGVLGASKRMEGPHVPVRSYTPTNPSGPFPYSTFDLTPTEPGNDASFYRISRFVTHIDDNAIIELSKYYDENLPKKGRILDFCSSWISHYPPRIEEAKSSGDIEVSGTGMNASELESNPVLNAWQVQDLNVDPAVKIPQAERALSSGYLDASTCVVSIDYLTKPVEVLQSIRQQTCSGGKVHLVISNRCFPNKVVGRWLHIEEDERLKMVGDYLWWSGWRSIEIVTVVQKTWMKDPLWVVRGENE